MVTVTLVKGRDLKNLTLSGVLTKGVITHPDS